MSKGNTCTIEHKPRTKMILSGWLSVKQAQPCTVQLMREAEPTATVAVVKKTMNKNRYTCKHTEHS